jgi:hypothetical protein
MRNQFRAACPGIGWEREQRQLTTIGGRSTQWRATTPDTTPPASTDAPDDDTVIVRGTD